MARAYSAVYLPLPAKLEDTAQVSSPVVRAVAKEFLKLAPLAPSEKATREHLTKQLEQQLTAFTNALDGYFATLRPVAAHTDPNDKQAQFDAHFHVIRTEGDADLLVASTIASFCKLYLDHQQGSTLLPIELAILFAATQRFVESFTTRGESNYEPAQRPEDRQPSA